ncbi:alpha-xylosidase [Paenibacillus albidus]|uniref:Alpha-xylosidase n=1 Tax=Paenibacillus albidus TaxID=2041023 RepID=A0A917C5V1_9BACL|nr:alpha/beta hydrolase-fold protein [Paenibacillus albidus]GGF70501.1 alpha-xylosidase [Paenibacillus albidus]
MATLQISLHSKCLKREVTFNALLPVDLPEGFGQPVWSGEPLRAVYLLHGFSGSHSDWLNFSRIRELSDRYQVAVFMPAGENHFYLDDENKGEYFGEYIGRELVDFTRKLFPLSAAREDTWIGGLSMGGYGAIRNGLKYAEQFGRIIALSSALIPYRIANIAPDYNDGIASYKYYTSVFGDLSQLLGSDKDPEKLVLDVKAKGLELPKLYMACGTEDFLLDVNRRFHDFLEGEKAGHLYEECTGAHTWDFWDKHIEAALKWAVEDSAYVINA